MNNYKPVIGLEIHIELKTKSKMFCQCKANYFGMEPNTNVCPVCLGLPGALPVPNRKAVEWTILIGKALNCTINLISKFDRKHYFYPDLPKGYQISQYDEPIATKGYLEIINFLGKVPGKLTYGEAQKVFRIHRVHLEEDTGKLLHVSEDTLVDFNRSGVPLVEIVTEPEFDNAQDVKIFLEELQIIVRYLGISDADMEKGSMRLEPNISIRKVPSSKSKINNKFQLPSYKIEVKNINSFKFVKLAIEHEIERQITLLERGETPKQETRGFDEKTSKTYSQRSKEEAQDYRYFPEPDIPPMEFTKKYLEGIFKLLPELPQKKLKRYVDKLGLKYHDAFVLTRDIKLTELYEDVLTFKSDKVSPQFIANVFINRKIKDTEMNKNPSSVWGDILTIYNLRNQIPTSIDETIIEKIVETNKKAVEDYKKGRENAIMFLVGQVMKEMRGKADANLIKTKLLKIIKK